MDDFVTLKQQQQPTQDRLPKVRETIDRVGISGLRTSLKLSNSGMETSYTAEIDLFIDLDEERKGIHMSRLVESINDVVSKGSRKSKQSFEQLGLHVLNELRKRHRYSKGEITIKTTLFMRRHTPVTNKPTDEPYDVSIGVIIKEDEIFKNLRVRAVGNTLCPHSLETTKGKAHVQRAEVDLSIEAPIKEKIPLEELIEICENSFSSPTYAVLKTNDEAAVVEEMFRNPKFVEDVARDCYRQAKNLKFKGRVKIRATSFESIHKHNAISEIERVFEMKTGLGMEFYVDYSHLLPGHPKCGVRHGHTARVIVELFGPLRSDGMIMDFKEMEENCWKVLSQVDHKDLNDQFERPTSENVANWIFSELKKSMPISRVNFFEGQGKWCVVEE